MAGLWDRFPTARTVQQMMDTMDRVIEDPLAFNGGWVVGIYSKFLIFKLEENDFFFL